MDLAPAHDIAPNAAEGPTAPSPSLLTTPTLLAKSVETSSSFLRFSEQISGKLGNMDGSFPFNVISHTIPVVSVREYPEALIDENKDVFLSVKQYTLRESASAGTKDNDPITIIASGGLGFIRELYEPLFAELYQRSRRTGLNIKSIWIADMFNTGQSAVANRHNLGRDPAWIDHARDLWSMINHFRKDMTRPLVGLGHSMGCNQLLYISHWHPRLFHSLAFIEAGIDPEYGKGITIPWQFQTLRRKDAFATRAEAEAELVAAHRASDWTEAAVARLKEYGVHEVEAGGKTEWRATTPKHQIAALVSRFNPDRTGVGARDFEDVTLEQRETVPDSDQAAWNPGGGVFYRAELKGSWDLLPHVRPWVLYVNGGKSPFFGRPKTRDERARLTGTGVGGNGGMKLGAVKQIVIEKGEHTMVFDQNMYTIADHVVEWLQAEVKRREGGEKARLQEWRAKSLEEKQSVSKGFAEALGMETRKMRKQKL